MEIMHGKNKINSECRFVGLKNNRLIYRCRDCKEEWKRPIEGLMEKFPRVYQFFNGNLQKFFLLLRRGVYPYECMDSWEKIDETSLPPEEDFYSELNFEGNSDEDYAHAQNVWGLLLLVPHRPRLFCVDVIMRLRSCDLSSQFFSALGFFCSFNR